MADVLKEIISNVAPFLREQGFKGSGQDFRLLSEKSVGVVNFQKSAGGQWFYVNVGIQPLFVPTEGNATPDPKKIKEYQCIFRTRLDPPEPSHPGWSYSLTVVKDLLEGLESLLSNYIKPLMAIPGTITEATVADFSQDHPHPLLGGRNARTFMQFARISLAMGNLAKAEEFIRTAMVLCPEKATTLRSDLQELLEKVYP